MSARNPWLVVGGCLSLVAALLHVACIFGGPEWYRFFGAGEAMAQAAERGHWLPGVLTAGIAAVLAIWAAYAFAAAGWIGHLPLMKAALVAISAIYLLRGLMLFQALALAPDTVTPFLIWSSLIVLVYGIAYAIGTWLAWPTLSPKGAS